jgi:alpha-L-fucosidase
MKNTTSGTSASAANRSTPEWYENAKFGIFIHWGPASVPGWAPKTDMNTLEMIRAKGLIYYFKHNPYAEWYFNSMRIEGSQTQQHHEEHWAPAPYEAFGPMFNEMSANLNYEYFTKWADLFQRAGARYVVPVSKHHDGFTLWPAATKKPGWCAQVDLIGKLRSAVLAKGMRWACTTRGFTIGAGTRPGFATTSPPW